MSERRLCRCSICRKGRFLRWWRSWSIVWVGFGFGSKRPKVNPDLDSSCQVCQEDTDKEFFMVHDFLWKMAINGLPDPGPMLMVGGKIYGGQFLCVKCIEHRLGRKLTSADFKSAPCMKMNYKRTKRLKQRMAA